MLTALSKVVGTHVKFFSLVKTTLDEMNEGGKGTMYFCLTERELLFVDRNLEVGGHLRTIN